MCRFTSQLFETTIAQLQYKRGKVCRSRNLSLVSHARRVSLPVLMLDTTNVGEELRWTQKFPKCLKHVFALFAEAFNEDFIWRLVNSNGLERGEEGVPPEGCLFRAKVPLPKRAFQMPLKAHESVFFTAATITLSSIQTWYRLYRLRRLRSQYCDREAIWSRWDLAAATFESLTGSIWKSFSRPGLHFTCVSQLYFSSSPKHALFMKWQSFVSKLWSSSWSA